MICVKCMAEIPDGSTFCMFCGKKQVADERRTRRSPNGTGTAYKRGKTWTAMVIKGYDVTEDRKLKAIKMTKGGFKTKADALNYCPILLRTEKQIKSKKTFKQVYDLWQEGYKDKIGKSTMDCYKSAIKYYEPIYTRTFVDVSPSEMQDCIDKCPHGKRTKQNMKALASLLFSWGKFNEICDVNKSEELYCGNDETKKYDAFTSENLESVIKSELPYSTYIVALCYLGCRPNELFKTKKTDYDKEHKCIVTGSKTEAGRDRVITISPKILNIIDEQMKTPGEYLFPCSNGKQMTVNHFQKLFRDIMGKLGIEGKVPYSCRHTFANLLKDVKGSDTDKASLMGHADASMTKYYQSADYDSLKAITDQI